MNDNLSRESWEITSREAWAERRGKDVTASNIGCLFEGANPYAGINDLVLHVSGQAPRRDSPAMRAGRLLESIFPEAIAEERPDWRLVKATTYHRLPELRLGGTPDYWRDSRGGFADRDLCECKAPSEHQWNDVWHGVPPLYINLQVQTQMLVTGVQSAVIAVIVRSSELPLHLFEVEAHPGAQRKILTAVADFWQRYDAGEFPVPVASDEIAAMLDDGSHVDLSADNHLPEWLERLEQLRKEIREADKSKKGIEDEIKNRVGAAATAWLPGWEISYRNEHRRGYTVEPSDPRILRVKRTKEIDNGFA